MTLPASGPISMSMINTEFGRASTSLISTNNAYAGTYGAINRNTNAGSTIYNRYNQVTFNYQQSDWYGYQHVGVLTRAEATIFNNTPVGMQVNADYSSPNVFLSQSLLANGSSTGVRTTYVTNGVLRISSITATGGSYAAKVAINVIDPNTGTTLYNNNTLVVPVAATTLATISSIQRFNMTITITPP